MLKRLPRLNKDGFTMIELLIVIALIGILAAAVLVGLNPIEQLNKGRDTSTRATGAELRNAIERFYAVQEKYPWNEATYSAETSDTDPDLAFPDGTTYTDAGSGEGYEVDSNTDWVQGLIDTGEVKETYASDLGDGGMYVSKAADSSVFVCFEPSSKQFQQEAVERCKEEAANLPSGACPGAPYSETDTYSSELICLP